MPRPVFKARVDASGRGTVAVDDHDISHLVTGFTVKTGVDHLSTVALTLVGPELDLQIEAEAVEGMPDVG